MHCEFDCDTFNRYRVDLPYPPVRIQSPNQHYARLISGAFGGEGSETTAIAQYGTHRFFLCDYPEIHCAYQYIAAVEMDHFNFLGSLIKALGLNPALFSYETNQYWNGSYPNYQYALKEILESDMEGEKSAIAHYTRLIHQIPEESIQALFARIILDEKKHIEVLSNFYMHYF
jgi:bacterioferritin